MEDKTEIDPIAMMLSAAVVVGVSKYNAKPGPMTKDLNSGIGWLEIGGANYKVEITRDSELND